MNVRPCPSCGYPVPRLGLDLGPMRCFRCDTVFTPPGEERVSPEPITPVFLIPDEDAPMYSVPIFSLDLSGNYPTDIVAWIEEAWAHFWWFCLLPLIIAIPVIPMVLWLGAVFHGVLHNWAILPLVLLIRPIWFGGLFLIAVRGMRDNCNNFDVFWEAFVSPRLLIANLAPSTLWGLVWTPLVLRDNRMADFWNGFVLCASVGLVVVAFYIHVRLWFVHILLLDARLTLVEAFRASWRLTRNHVLGLSAYLLLLAAILILGGSLCCVGIFPALAFVLLAEASAYLHATGQLRSPRPEENR